MTGEASSSTPDRVDLPPVAGQPDEHHLEALVPENDVGQGDQDTEPVERELFIDKQLDDAPPDPYEGTLEALAAYWPSNDRNFPDYASIADVPSSAQFAVTPALLDGVFAANRFSPEGKKTSSP